MDDVRTAIKNHNGYVYIPNLKEFMEISQKNSAAVTEAELIPMNSGKIIYGKGADEFR